ncbi:DUF397 domain-containing protein [Embleya sp. AB8]|uniref:DUF397 domain-containing protein n=1 Tax=Embleya sp. AB8 TaxID=3156304 RepID=UPI003C751628
MQSFDVNATPWRKSTYSGGTSDCVESAVMLSGRAGVRDSKCPTAPGIAFQAQAWASFLSAQR